VRAGPHTFRVFISSTFGDLAAERDALQARVFPRLRRLCEARGFQFQAVDLRWGVVEEAGFEQQTMRICAQEILRCQEITPRPNFIVLLGDRYGWRPLPWTIPANEFAAIDQHVTKDERELLADWYRRDDNSEPLAQYLLQPRRGAWRMTIAGIRSRVLSHVR
jgi:NACHT domain- and WD repeat-containing protein